MATLNFKNVDLKKMLDATPKAKTLYFVKDDGIYVMTRTIDNKAAGVVYADGYSKSTTHEKMRAAVGGDDFAEEITLSKKLKSYIIEGGYSMQINITPNSKDYGISFIRTRPRDLAAV